MVYDLNAATWNMGGLFLGLWLIPMGAGAALRIRATCPRLDPCRRRGRLRPEDLAGSSSLRLRPRCCTAAGRHGRRGMDGRVSADQGDAGRAPGADGAGARVMSRGPGVGARATGQKPRRASSRTVSEAEAASGLGAPRSL